MTRTFKRSLAALGALAALVPAARASAQSLGGYRQFLSIEPYFVNMQLDDGGTGIGRTGLNGYGGRLWINYAPFVRSRALAKGGLALFAHTATKDGARVTHYGAEQDVFFTNRPFGGFFDPLISVGAGAYRTSYGSVQVNTPGGPTVVGGGHTTKFALSPGVGVRIPVPNRFQLRVDARDAILFSQNVGTEKKTLNNFEFTGSIGITF